MAAGHSAPANAGHIVSISQDQLTKLMDLAERQADFIDRKLPELEQRDAAAAAEFEDLKGIVDDVRKNYRALDDTQDRGSKNYRAATPLHEQAEQALGNDMYAALQYFKRGFRNLPEEYKQAKRTFEAQKRAADQIEETESLGGITVPTLTTTTIARLQKERVLGRELCFNVPMKSDKQDVPTIENGGEPAAYYVSNGNAPTNSVVTFLTTKQLVSKTVMCVQLLEQEMLEDTSVDDFTGFWARIFLDQFALKENRAVFSETATDSNSAFTGAVQAVTAFNSGSQLVTLAGTHFSSITYDDLVAMQALVAEGAQERAVWVGSRSTLRWIQALVDTQKRPLLQSMWQGILPSPDPKPNGVMGRPTILLGAPYYITAGMPGNVSGTGKVCLLYGDFSQGHYFGDRKKIEVGFSTDAAYATGGVMFRMRERFAALNVLSEGFAASKNA